MEKGQNNYESQSSALHRYSRLSRARRGLWQNGRLYGVILRYSSYSCRKKPSTTQQREVGSFPRETCTARKLVIFKNILSALWLAHQRRVLRPGKFQDIHQQFPGGKRLSFLSRRNQTDAALIVYLFPPNCALSFRVSQVQTQGLEQTANVHIAAAKSSRPEQCEPRYRVSFQYQVGK